VPWKSERLIPYRGSAGKKFVAMSKKKHTFAASKTQIVMNKEFWKKALEFIVKVLQIAIAVFLGGSINL
jgi:hypothetical protein